MTIIHSSLQRRIQVSVLTLIIVLVAALALGVWWSQQRAARAMSTRLGSAAAALSQRQQKECDALRDRMQATLVAALKDKLTTVAKLVAGLSLTPILTEDYGVLENYCQQLVADEDLVWAVVSKDRDKALAQAQSAQGKEALAKAGVDAKAPLADRLAAMDKAAGFMVVHGDILADGKKKGELVLVASDRALVKQRAETDARFAEMIAGGKAAFDELRVSMTEGIDEANLQSLLIVLAIAIAGLVIAVIIAMRLASGITRPVAAVGQVIDALAQGDLTRRAAIARQDEVGAMADGLNRSLEQLRGAVGTITQGTQGLATAAEGLTAVSHKLDTGAEANAQRAESVVSASQQVSTNVATIAAGVEELGASVSEISQNAQQAATVASEAVRLADGANSTVGRLGISSTEIGSIVKLISSIAEQTNLLALNATIEAARAGEAGRGFAVVASEVKELARQTGSATEDIGRKIAAIEGDSRAAIAAIAQITEIIKRINDLQQSIASAVEEQAATTRELTGNVGEVAKGSAEIASSITGVAQSIQETRTGAADTLRSAQELARLATELRTAVARFRC